MNKKILVLKYCPCLICAMRGTSAICHLVKFMHDKPAGCITSRSLAKEQAYFNHTIVTFYDFLSHFNWETFRGHSFRELLSFQDILSFWPGKLNSRARLQWEAHSVELVLRILRVWHKRSWLPTLGHDCQAGWKVALCEYFQGEYSFRLVHICFISNKLLIERETVVVSIELKGSRREWPLPDKDFKTRLTTARCSSTIKISGHSFGHCNTSQTTSPNVLSGGKWTLQAGWEMSHPKWTDISYRE